MADGQVRLLLQSDWSVFDRLAAEDERDLRRILRSHRDVPFRGDIGYDEKETALRADLDAALDRLSLIELAIEARVPRRARSPQARRPQEAVWLQRIRALHQFLPVPRDSFHCVAAAGSGWISTGAAGAGASC